MENKNQETKKTGWFSKLGETIGSAIFETDASKTEETTSIPSTENTTSTSKFAYSDVSNSNVPAGMIIPNQNGVYDEKFYNSFLKIIEDNNIDGIDYYEFSKAKKANDGIPGFTEQMKYQAAYSSLKANSNLTKDTLLQTADFYIGKLNDEETSFNTEMQHEIDSEVGSRLKEATAKQDEIVAKQEQIVKLQSEMSALQGEIGSLNNEAQQIQAKIESTARNFKVSLEILKGQINLDKQNITTFIQQ